MENQPTKITVSTTVNVPVEKAWHIWGSPEHITQWNSASPDWHTPRAENDLRTGGKFSSRMEAKDGSFGFDFGCVYDEVIDHQRTIWSSEQLTEAHRSDGRVAGAQIRRTFLK